MPCKNASLTKMPAHRRYDSGELDVFDATLYYSGGLDCIATNSPIIHQSSEIPKIRTTPPPPSHSHSIKVEKPVRDNRRPKQPSSPGAKLASFVNAIFHQTKSKSKSIKTPRSPKNKLVMNHGESERGSNRSQSLHPTIPKLLDMELRRHHSYEKPIDGPWLVRQAKSSEENRVFGDELVEYSRVLNKATNRLKDPVEVEENDCDQSVCSSDLFELESCDVGRLSWGLSTNRGDI